MELFRGITVAELANEVIEEVSCFVGMRVIMLLVLYFILLVEVGFHESVEERPLRRDLQFHDGAACLDIVGDGL